MSIEVKTPDVKINPVPTTVVIESKDVTKDEKDYKKLYEDLLTDVEKSKESKKAKAKIKVTCKICHKTYTKGSLPFHLKSKTHLKNTKVEEKVEVINKPLSIDVDEIKTILTKKPKKAKKIKKSVE